MKMMNNDEDAVFMQCLLAPSLAGSVMGAGPYSYLHVIDRFLPSPLPSSSLTAPILFPPLFCPLLGATLFMPISFSFDSSFDTYSFFDTFSELVSELPKVHNLFIIQGIAK